MRVNCSNDRRVRVHTNEKCGYLYIYVLKSKIDVLLCPVEPE